MKGLSEKGAKAVERLIQNKFDLIAMRILGFIPKRSKQKSIVFQTTRDNLISLFLQALGTRNPNTLEEQTLKVLLSVANGYIEALKERTASRVVHEVDSYVRNQNNSKKPISSKKINKLIDTQMGKAKNHLKLIANTESNKAVNFGTALQISKVAESQKEEDPTVYFVVTIDDVTGPEEFVLHLLSDHKTPRVWKLSELGSEYHKVGDPNPKLAGLHPNCRCKLTYLAKGWGFDKSGKVKYIGPDWDEFKHQRKEYGLPR